jgi:C-terminal processing protease CtpA/Prc
MVLLALAPLAIAGAQQNLSFEIVDAGTSVPQGWNLPRTGGAALHVTVDSSVASEGSRSLQIARLGEGGVARVTQRLTLQEGAVTPSAVMRVRLTGHVRAKDLASGEAALWLRVDGPRGFLAVDSRGAPEAPASAQGWQQLTIQAPLPSDAREISFGAQLRSVGTAWFDAFELEMLDAKTLPPPSAAARHYVEAALDIMQEHSLRTREIEWPVFRAATIDQARGAETAADAHLALRYALRNLGDYHSYLVTPQTAKALSVSPVANARTGRSVVEPRGTALEGGLAYLSVPGFAGGTALQQVAFADRLQGLIRELEPAAACGWIVDLRDNGGGNLWPMLAGVGPLLGDGEVGASVYSDGRRVPFWYRDGKVGFGDYVQLRVSGASHRLMQGSPRIAVLIGPETASSGEVLAMALRARDGAATFGGPTRGLPTGNRTFPLADGAALVLTVAATSDPVGRVLRGVIEPDQAVALGSADEAAASDAARAWLRGSCS